jgi:hypothetical protein
MTNYIKVNFDLYVHVNNLKELEKGNEVIGYKQVSNPNEYELISHHAFLPTIQLSENEFSVCAIIE